jgi:hypothetical protein
MRTFELYRFTHADGTAKDWAYAEVGEGRAEIRWGPQNQLRQSQIKPLHEAWERASQKVRKGYVKVGLVDLDATGQVVHSRRHTVKTPVDLKGLLGPADDGFYF